MAFYYSDKLAIVPLPSSPFFIGSYVNTFYKPPNETEARPIGKCFVSKVDDENLTFILGERSHLGRAAEILDFRVLSEYNSVRQA